MFVYRRLASPLHAARASVGAVWTMAIAVAALSIDHPLVLCAIALSVVLAGAASGVRRELVRSLRTAAIVAVPIVVVNVLVARDGLTVLARLGDLGPFGQGNLTLEALVYGVAIALKVTILMLATTLASLAVDPDELLRGVRRLSFRSALTASLATRMIPVLANDGRRLAEAQRTRPAAERARRSSSSPVRGRWGGGYMRLGVTRAHAREAGLTSRARARVTLLSAIVGSSLDRAMDVAATLELRGFATASRAPRSSRRWSRHDLSFAGSALGLGGLAVAAHIGGIGSFDAYPELHAGNTATTVALAVVFAVVVLLPFADRRGIEL
ncbi:MAG TPA: energy-coupling factor transporter transmembrane component T [Solirubrobacteraceae bacterium]|jgi:energy-coupling factor transport system permease protein